jgi:hypothetical protein
MASSVIPTWSSAWIHEYHCPPSPTGPPSPTRKIGNSFASAPPSEPSTRPVRSLATRMPSAAAVSASASHATHTRAKKSSPGGLVSTNVAVRLVP